MRFSGQILKHDLAISILHQREFKTVPGLSAEEEIERHKNGPTFMPLSPRQCMILQVTSSNQPRPKNKHIEGIKCHDG